MESVRHYIWLYSNPFHQIRIHQWGKELNYKKKHHKVIGKTRKETGHPSYYILIIPKTPYPYKTKKTFGKLKINPLSLFTFRHGKWGGFFYCLLCSLKTEQYSAFFTFLLLSAETGKLHERTHFMPSGLRRFGASVSKAITGRSIKDTCVQS